MKLLLPVSALALILGFFTSARAQDPNDASVALRELLAAPAPIPRSAEKPPKTNTRRPPDFFNSKNVPPDDAPVEDLLEYWIRWATERKRPTPSDTVRQRLLDACVDDLEKLDVLLPLFPSSESVATKIKQAFDHGAGNPQLEQYRSPIKTWLLFNSKYFVDELLTLANTVKDNERYGSVEKAEALVSLAKFDWPTAEPLLETLVNSGQQRSATLALTLFYQHAIDEKDTSAELKFRGRLQSIASDRSLPGHARYYAIEALSESEWSGRDEWYLSLFHDESLIQLTDGVYGFSTLNTLFAREPDKWIPIITKLVSGKAGPAQKAAAQCLMLYVIAHPRRDAILPILRWLTEPDSIPPTSNRSSFIHTLAELDVPESVPGLIWVVENDEDYSPWAARALARYKDARAIPALKKALAVAREDDRPLIVQGLLASGGLTEAEQVAALEAYATMLTTPSGREAAQRYRYNESLPIPVSIGRYFAELGSPPDSLVRAVLIRASTLKTKKPAVSRSLTDVAHRWQGRQIDLDLVNRIAANTAEATTLLNALNRRAELRENVKPELHSLIAASGAPKGIGAALLEDRDIAASILSSNDQMAQVALLVSARQTQAPLPIDTVGPLLKSTNALLALAAKRYLLAEDSKEARTLLWQHHPNEAFITGWRENVQLPGGNNFDLIGKQEDKLRNELLKPDGPLEIFALLVNSDHQSQILRIYADKAVYTHYEDPSRYLERVVTKNELSAFKQFVSTNDIADLGPQFSPCHLDCWISQFLMLSRNEGRRVFIQHGIGNMAAVANNFRQLGTGEGVKTHFSFEKDIKGLEVLYANPSLPVLDVWQHGNEIRIFVERPETEVETANRVKDYLPDEDDDTRAERWYREYAQRKARQSWRSLKDNDAGSITTAPDGYSTFDFTRFPFDEYDSSGDRTEWEMQALTPNSILIARRRDGLWKQIAGTKPVRISEENGAYTRPIVTPDGKWAVIAKSDTIFGRSNYLVRLNVETGQESRVTLEPARLLLPIAFLPPHNKVLLRREKGASDQSSENPAAQDDDEYLLLEPSTGVVQTVSGEFAPLEEEGKRFLQPTKEPNQYWAAIHYETKNQTVVGRYSLKDFSFKPVLTVPEISFDSRAMWVDEKQGKLYLVYTGQLLRLLLARTPQ